MTEIHQVSIQIRRPMGNDPGEVEAAFYTVEGDVIVLTDRAGEPLVRQQSIPRRRGAPAPLQRYERKLKPGENVEWAAKELLMTKRTASKRGSDFNRPLRAPELGIV